MQFELKPVTAPGERLVALAEEHAAEFATRADEHDRENTFVTENFAAMKESGFLAGCVPEQFGGIGVDSVHDLTIAISRLGRGCGSTAISVNMHMVSVLLIARMWKRAGDAGDTARANQLQVALPMIGKMVLMGSGTERGTIAIVPNTEATPVDGGYLVNGHKIFGTNSEIADAFAVFMRVAGDDGRYHLAIANIPRATKGLDVKMNWDALGMRGSGSHDIVLTDCFIPAPMLNVIAPIGEPSAAGLANVIASNFPLVGAFLGIAEAAREHSYELATTRKKQPLKGTYADRPIIQYQMAEIEIGLTAARGALGRTGLLIDEYITVPDAEMTDDGIQNIMKEFQAAKIVVNRAAHDIVDRAMTISGGSGYLSSSPLSRLYRDVRAGPFMQPFSPNEAFDYIGQVAFGIDPNAELREAVKDLRPPARGSAAD